MEDEANAESDLKNPGHRLYLLVTGPILITSPFSDSMRVMSGMAATDREIELSAQSDKV